MKVQIFAAVLAFFLSVAPLRAQLPEGGFSQPRSFGESGQDVIYVFTSLTCPHCADYHKNVLPLLKQEFVTPGLARVVIVDMPFDPRAAAGTILSRCVAPESYDAFMEKMYENQPYWVAAKNPQTILFGYAQSVGMDEEAINRCFSNKELKKAIISQRDNLSKLYNIRGMPSTVLVHKGRSSLWTGTDAAVILDEIKQELAK